MAIDQNNDFSGVEGGEARPGIFSRFALALKARFGTTAWGLAFAVILGIFIGLSGFTFLYGEGFSYLSQDPAACVNCHIMRPQYESWQKASHHAVANCVDCHLPHEFIPKWLAKAENGYLHSKGFTLQDFHEPILIRESSQRVLQHNCLQCHAGLVHELVAGATTDADAVSCLHCHRSVGHGESVGLGKYEAAHIAKKQQAGE